MSRLQFYSGMATNVPAPWVYSNWITFGAGTATRLTALRNFIQEVYDRISQKTSYSLKGRTVDPPLAELRSLLADLQQREELEAERVDITSGARLGWTQGFAQLSPGTVPGDSEQSG